MLTSWAVYLTLLLCGCALAQDTVIDVDLDNATRENNNVYLIVPPVSNLVFRSVNTIAYVSNGNNTCDEGRGTHLTCTLNLNQPTSNLILDIIMSVTTMGVVTRIVENLNVSVTVNPDYVFGCSKYVFPVRLNVTEMTGKLTCVPVFVNTTRNASSVEWFRGFTPDGVNKTKIDDSRVNQVSSGGVMNASIVFRTASVEDAAYYFPKVDGVEPDETPPILVTYQPQIISGVAEFSRELYIDPNFPQSTTFSCTVRSFPKATVMWRHFNVTNGNSSLTCSQASDGCFFNVTSVIGTPNTYHYNLTIVSVDFANSGIYSCFAENDAFKFEGVASTNAHSYHLRVKDHLRPLWPAVGTLAVPIVLVLLMLVGTLWDKMIAIYCFNEDSPSPGEKRRNTIGSSSSGSPVQLTESHVSLRRISSANVQLLEEPGTI